MVSMRIRAYATIAASITALVVAAGASAVAAPRADRATPEQATVTRENRVPAVQTPKAAAKAKPTVRAAAKTTSATKRTTRPLLMYVVPAITNPSVESGVGGADNCASYLGCTAEEYCIVWGLRCELVPPPVGSLRLREPPAL
jgi:hypothetical protein